MSLHNSYFSSGQTKKRYKDIITLRALIETVSRSLKRKSSLVFANSFLKLVPGNEFANLSKPCSSNYFCFGWCPVLAWVASAWTGALWQMLCWVTWEILF